MTAPVQVAFETPTRRLWAGLSMAFVTYVVTTGLSAVPAALAQAGVADAIGSFPGGAAALREPGGGILLEVLHRSGRRSGEAVSLATLASGGMAALLAPLLSVAWLAAMAEPRSVRQALGVGARRYLPAVASALLLAVPMLIVLAIAVALPVALHHALDVRPDARLHDLSVALASLPAVAVVVVWATAHDLVRAALAAHGGVFPALGRGLAALRPRIVARYVLWTALATALAIVAVVVSARLGLGSPLQATAAVALGQLAALGRILARGRWLAEAVHRV